MDRSEFDLTQIEASHAHFMRAITRGVSDTPLVLKGGTALMFGYGLDRFSEDLDFDAPHKLNLEGRIQRNVPHGTSIIDISAIKDTETMTRYRVNYASEIGQGKLKIEVSYRTPVSENDVRIVDGMRLLSLEKLVDHKLAAAHDGNNPRTAIRDLYDLDFIVRNYGEIISPVQVERFRSFASDPVGLAEQYRDAYQFDDLIRNRVTLDDLVINLCSKVDELSKIADQQKNQHKAPDTEQQIAGDTIPKRPRLRNRSDFER